MRRKPKYEDLKEETAKALDQRGLKLQVVESTELPLMQNNRIVVGMNERLPLTNRDVAVTDWYGSISVNVRNYLEEKELNSRDVLWWPIYMNYVDGKVDYTTQENTNDAYPDDRGVGFVVMHMSDFDVEKEDGFMLTRLVQQATDCVELELMSLAHWQNKDVHHVSLELKGNVVQSKENVLLTTGMLDVVVSSMIHRFDADALDNFIGEQYKLMNNRRNNILK